MTDCNLNYGNPKVTQNNLAKHPLGLPKADDKVAIGSSLQLEIKLNQNPLIDSTKT